MIQRSMMFFSDKGVVSASAQRAMPWWLPARVGSALMPAEIPNGKLSAQRTVALSASLAPSSLAKGNLTRRQQRHNSGKYRCAWQHSLGGHAQPLPD